MNNYKVGEIIKCMVTAIENYGFFVSTELWYSGLIHISEITDGYVKDINQFVKIGDVIYCQILDVNEQEKHIKLSIKNINYKSAKNLTLDQDKKEFMELKEQLPNWIEDKLKEIENK